MRPAVLIAAGVLLYWLSRKGGDDAPAPQPGPERARAAAPSRRDACAGSSRPAPAPAAPIHPRPEAPRAPGRFVQRHADWARLTHHARALPFASRWRIDTCISLQDECWTLDLHGLDVQGAKTATQAFLHDARRQGLRTCRVVTGRGNHSRRRAVLPDAVAATLSAAQSRGELRAWRNGDGYIRLVL